MKRKKLIILLIPLVFILMFVALSIFKSYKFKKMIENNHLTAMKVLLELCSNNSTWYQADFEENHCLDYWTADIAGFRNAVTDRELKEEEKDLLPIEIYLADYCPLPSQKGIPEIKRRYKGPPVPLHGYYFAVFPFQSNGKPFNTDEDGNGQAYENHSSYAYMAFPVEYGKTGKYAFIVDSSLRIWRIDAIRLFEGNRFNDPLTKRPSTGPGTPPVKQFPNKDILMKYFEKVFEFGVDNVDALIYSPMEN